jgi:general secretion pathway protein D
VFTPVPAPVPAPFAAPVPAPVAVPVPAPVPAPVPVTKANGQQMQNNDKVLLSLSAPQHVRVNQIIFASVNVDKLSLFKSAVLEIECDPKLAGFIQAGPGTLLNSTLISIKPDQPQDKSRIILNITNAGEGISGSGSMVQIALKANAKGNLNLILKNVQIVSAASGKPDNVSLSGAKVEIQ